MVPTDPPEEQVRSDVVSKIATGYTTDSKGRPFVRRSLTPGLVVIAVLAVLAVGAWTFAFSGRGDDAVQTDCTLAAGAKLTVVDHSEMRNVGPAALSTFGVRVLNSAAARGSARSVSDDLGALGYRAADPAYADDTVYPDRNLDCVAQIRFGSAGQAAAAAVWLVSPCAQLVNDGRPGTDVDLALGSYYTSTQPSQDAQSAIDALRVATGTQKQSPVDQSLLDAVHGQSC